MSYTEVKDSTSSAVGSEIEGSVFDVTIAGYGRLRSRAEDFMIQALKANLSNSLKHYFTRAQWTTVGDVPTVLSVTAELDQPLQVSATLLILLLFEACIGRFSFANLDSGTKRVYGIFAKNTIREPVSPRATLRDEHFSRPLME